MLAAVLSSKYLHPEIREKGGAYGGGASAGEEDYIFILVYSILSDVDSLNTIILTLFF